MSKIYGKSLSDNPYERWLDAIATQRQVTKEVLVETYGDMLSDMFSCGDSVHYACAMLDGEDQEWEGKDRVYNRD